MSKKEEQVLKKQLEEENSIFADVPIISCYSWEDAVNDGMFIEKTELAKECGFRFPVALTANVFSAMEGETEEETKQNIMQLLAEARNEIVKNPPEPGQNGKKPVAFQHDFNGDNMEVWLSVEGRKPSNPEPVITILFPEDY